MKKTIKRVLSLILIGMLVISIGAGCGQQPTENPDSSSTPDPGQSEDPVEEIPLSEMEPITFEMFKPWAGMELPDDDAVITQMIYDKTKVRINFTLPPAEANEKLNLMLVSEEYPDLIEFPDYGSLKSFIDAGVLIELNDIVPQNAPNLMANLGPIFDQLKQEDGKIYHIPTWFRAMGKEEFPEGSSDIYIKTSVLGDMDWFNPETLEDLTKVLEKVRDETDMIPIMAPLADPGFSVSSMIRGASGLAGTEDIYLDENNKVQWLYNAPQAREYIGWMNMLYREGMLSEESITMRSETIDTKLASGELYASFWVWSYVAGLEDAMLTAYVKLDDSVEKMTYSTYSTYYPTGYGITKDNEDPERFLKFVNWINSEEGYLTTHGPTNMDGDTYAEGYNHYVLDGAIYPSEAMQIAGAENDNYWLQQGLWFWNQFHSDTSNPATTDIDFLAMEADVSRWWSDIEREVFPKLGLEGTDYWPNQRAMGTDVSEVAELPLDPDSEENVIKVDVSNYLGNELPKMIIAKTEEEFNALYDKFIETAVGYGIDQYIEKMEELHQVRLELLN